MPDTENMVDQPWWVVAWHNFKYAKVSQVIGVAQLAFGGVVSYLSATHQVGNETAAALAALQGTVAAVINFVSPNPETPQPPAKG